mmetsp:Transcript_5799/g.14758  ORF Transcript_5799/g.14758 Transcript_5799/m.14758 type:complete len:251 (+) Transcript_5799:282-1034(+)
MPQALHQLPIGLVFGLPLRRRSVASWHFRLRLHLRLRLGLRLGHAVLFRGLRGLGQGRADLRLRRCHGRGRGRGHRGSGRRRARRRRRQEPDALEIRVASHAWQHAWCLAVGPNDEPRRWSAEPMRRRDLSVLGEATGHRQACRGHLLRLRQLVVLQVFAHPSRLGLGLLQLIPGHWQQRLLDHPGEALRVQQRVAYLRMLREQGLGRDRRLRAKLLDVAEDIEQLAHGQVGDLIHEVLGQLPASKRGRR